MNQLSLFFIAIMKATLYFTILLGLLLCNIVCDYHEKEAIHSIKAFIDNVPKFEKIPLFHNEKYGSTEAVDRDELIEVENGDSVLSFEDDSTIRSSLEPEDNFEENYGGVGGFETNEQVQRKKGKRGFIEIKEKLQKLQKFNKYSRLNVVKEIFPLQKKLRHNDNILSEEESEKDESKKEGSVEEVPDEEEWFSNEDIPSQEQDSVIVQGARAWAFETQDVNLTLTYPLAQTHPLDRQYIITGFNVLLVTDGVDSRGYINSGGVLSDNISLSFISPGISSVLYEFQVYGIPRYSGLDGDRLNTLFYLCS